MGLKEAESFNELTCFSRELSVSAADTELRRQERMKVEGNMLHVRLVLD